MAKRSAAPDKLTISKLTKEDQDWLQAEADRLGCDAENLVRMMIRQRMAVGSPFAPPDGPPPGYREPRYYDDQKWAAAEPDGPVVDPYAPPPGETINEADESLDALMSAPPSLIEEPAAPPPRPRFDYRRQINLANVVPLQRQQRRYNGGAFGAGSMTAPAGISEYARTQNMMGDGAGNVMRDNFRHFGFGGTRNR